MPVVIDNARTQILEALEAAAPVTSPQVSPAAFHTVAAARADGGGQVSDRAATGRPWRYSRPRSCEPRVK